MKKIAEATSVPFADSAVDKAVSAPLPELAVGNKPAPGQTGPKGLAPRTNYSRVNTGSPPPADLGASSQKGTPSDAQSFLPTKVAHQEVPMSEMTPRFTIQEMIKAASAGAQGHAAVTLEAARQLTNQGDAPASVKTASSQATPGYEDSIPTAYVEKLASAAEYVIANMQLAEEAEEAKTASATGPGKGPNPMQVLETTSSNNEFASGNQGQATSAHVVPKTPGTHKPAETPHGPSNALATNATMKHAGLDIAAIRKHASTKTAGAVRDAVVTAAHFPGRVAERLVGGKDVSRKKEASAPVDERLVEGMLSITKQAEDAINPAKIAGGAAVPPETSAAGEAGGAPAGGQPQGPTGLVGSNEAAANYTKGQAKAPMRAQLKEVLTEPALSSAHDSTLNKAFDNTGKAGVKLAASVRATAARAVLEKMAEEAVAPEDKDKSKKKEKSSMGGGAGFTAPPVGGVGAAGAGM